jgi:hypothetical protein
MASRVRRQTTSTWEPELQVGCHRQAGEERVSVQAPAHHEAQRGRRQNHSGCEGGQLSHEQHDQCERHVLE